MYIRNTIIQVNSEEVDTTNFWTKKVVFLLDSQRFWKPINLACKIGFHATPKEDKDVKKF